MTTVYTHLPGVALDPSIDQADFCDGIVRHMPFDEWYALDGGYRDNQRHYEKSNPVFYQWESENGLADFPPVKARIERVHRSLLLDWNGPVIPSPLLSASYQTNHEIAGYFEKEWIVFGSVIATHFKAEDLQKATLVYHLLAETDWDQSYEGIEAGLAILEMSASPDFWYTQSNFSSINEFVLCVTALESIVIPAKEDAAPGMQLTSTFAQNMSVFTNPNRDDLQNRSEWLANIYRLRSRLIHGILGPNQLNDEQRNLLHQARPILAFVIRHAMALKRATSSNEKLPKRLADAWKDPALHEAMMVEINKGYQQ